MTNIRITFELPVCKADNKAIKHASNTDPSQFKQYISQDRTQTNLSAQIHNCCKSRILQLLHTSFKKLVVSIASSHGIPGRNFLQQRLGNSTFTNKYPISGVSDLGIPSSYKKRKENIMRKQSKLIKITYTNCFNATNNSCISNFNSCRPICSMY